MLISISKAIEMTSLGRSTIYNLLNAGFINSVKIGRRNLITQESLDALINGGVHVKSIRT